MLSCCSTRNLVPLAYMDMKPSSVGNPFNLFIHRLCFILVDRVLSLIEILTKDFRNKTRLQAGLVEGAEQDQILGGAHKISRHELLPMGSRRFSGRLVPVLSLAFAMCTHLRLGQDCKLSAMPPQLLKRVVEACTSEPEDDIDTIGMMPDNDILDVKSKTGDTPYEEFFPMMDAPQLIDHACNWDPAAQGLKILRNDCLCSTGVDSDQQLEHLLEQVRRRGFMPAEAKLH